MISNKKYFTTVVLLVALSMTLFFSGMKMGAKGYTYSGGNYQIVNQNEAPKDVDYNLLWQALDVVNKKYIDKPIDQQKVLYGAISGAVAAVGDPYTAFFDPKQYSDFKTELGGAFDGIGAEVGPKDGLLVIIAPIDDAPAQKAGIMAGDVLLKIDDTDATTLTLEEAVSKIRGPKGTQVHLTIFRPASKKQLDFKITRDTIEIKSVKNRIENINGKKIEIIDIDRFGDDTVDLFKKAAADATSNKVDGIVIDLRDDPGGYLDAAVQIASYWVNPGDLVVSEKHSDGTQNDFKALGNNSLSKIPTVIMMNGGSASAAEILTGALKDHGFAKTVGTKSFGKGSVQELINLPQGAAVKVTVAKWYTPNNININKNGLEPDNKVEITPEQVEAKKDPQLDKAYELLTK
jgi:carboxyl-terminal processing protease